MKTSVVTAILLLASAGCMAQRMPADSLEQRDGVSYRIGSQVPFTGKADRMDSTTGTRMEIEYRNGMPEGLMRSWYPNGQLQVEGTLHGQTREGTWKAWHENGKLLREGTFQDGKEEGRFSWYFEDGRLSKQGDYHAGKENGRWTWYHENGRKMQEGTLLDGVETGVWKEWYPNGKPKMSGSLTDGKKEGQWTWWDEDGNKTVKTYSQDRLADSSDGVDLHVERMGECLKERDRNGALAQLDSALVATMDRTEGNPEFMWLAIFRSRVFEMFNDVEQAQTVLLRSSGISAPDVATIVQAHDSTSFPALHQLAGRMERELRTDAHIAPHVALALVHNILQDSVSMRKHQQWMMDHAPEDAKDWILRMSLDLYRQQANKVKAYRALAEARQQAAAPDADRSDSLYLAAGLIDLARFKEALPITEAYLQRDSTDLDFTILRLNIAMGMGDMDSMRRYRDAALRLDPHALDE
jgi:antitoxin component YwqK of YwqJK toxin-antitoxin module